MKFIQRLSSVPAQVPSSDVMKQSAPQENQVEKPEVAHAPGGVTFGQKAFDNYTSKLTAEQLQRLRKLNDLFSTERTAQSKQRQEPASKPKVAPENQLTAEEKEFLEEKEEMSDNAVYPTRYPRKAKNIRVSQHVDEEEYFDSNGEDDEMVYHEDWVESQQDFAPKHFEGIPEEWHETIKVKNPHTQRVKLFFKCKYPGCTSTFKKSCNLRDHFRKHTGLRPFTCAKCQKTFT